MTVRARNALVDLGAALGLLAAIVAASAVSATLSIFFSP